MLKKKLVPSNCKNILIFGDVSLRNLFWRTGISQGLLSLSPSLRLWTRTSLAILRASALREVMLKGISKLDKVGMKDLRSSAMNGRFSEIVSLSHRFVVCLNSPLLGIPPGE